MTKGIKKPLYAVRPITDIRDMLTSSVKEFSDKPAYLEKKDGKFCPISYNKYYDDVCAFGTALLDLGLLGKRVAVIGDNCYGWVVAYMAVVCGLGVIVPLDKNIPTEEINNALVISGAEAIVYSESVEEKVKEAGKDAPALKHYLKMYDESFFEKGRELISAGNTQYKDLPIDIEAMSILLFTSGTSGAAKAVELSHKNIATNLMSMCSMLYIDPSDVFLSVLPIHHTYECTCGFLCQLYRGTTVAFCTGLRHIVDELKEANTSVMLCVPLIVETIYNRIWKTAKKSGLDKKLKMGIKINNFLKVFGIDLSDKLFAKVHETFGENMRMFIIGAAAPDPVVSKGIGDLGFKIVQGYGMTECAPIVALNRDKERKDDAAGLPLPGLEIKIENPDEHGAGEIVVRGDSVMIGYHKITEDTDTGIEDGWFHTGDLGRFDKDGFIHIEGRKKNVIITKNGENVYPETLETYLSRSAYIIEAVVYAEQDKKDVTVAAIIVPDKDAIKGDGIDVDDKDAVYNVIKAEVDKINAKLSIEQKIRSFEIQEEEFEKTTTRKIKRYKIEKLNK